MRLGPTLDAGLGTSIVLTQNKRLGRSHPPLRPPTEHGPGDAEQRRRNQAPGRAAGGGNAGADGES